MMKKQLSEVVPYFPKALHSCIPELKILQREYMLPTGLSGNPFVNKLQEPMTCAGLELGLLVLGKSITAHPFYEGRSGAHQADHHQTVCQPLYQF